MSASSLDLRSFSSDEFDNSDPSYLLRPYSQINRTPIHVVPVISETEMFTNREPRRKQFR